MTTEEIREELSFIRSMVERARSETAESGHFFVWIGLFLIIAVFGVSRIEAHAGGGLALVSLGIVTVIGGAIGYVAVRRVTSGRGARSYPSTVCYNVWFGCSVPAIIVTFVLPALGAYPWSLTPVLSSLFIGVGLFASGVIFKSNAIVWCSLAWWAGAVAIVPVQGTPRVIVLMAMIVIGWLLPGWILRTRYRAWSRKDDA